MAQQEEPQEETQEQIMARIQADIAKVTNVDYKTQIAQSLDAETERTAAKVSLIRINEQGSPRYIDSSTTPNTDILNDGTIFKRKRRMADQVAVRVQATTEDKIFIAFPWICNIFGRWGYKITDRQRNVDTQDPTKITNIFLFQKVADPEVEGQ